MPSALPIFMESPAASDGMALESPGNAGEHSGESNAGNGIFSVNLSDAISTMPREPLPGPALEFFVSAPAPAPLSSDAAEAADHRNVEFNDDGTLLAAMAWENGCQLELAMGLENRPPEFSPLETDSGAFPGPSSSPVPAPSGLTVEAVENATPMLAEVMDPMVTVVSESGVPARFVPVEISPLPVKTGIQNSMVRPAPVANPDFRPDIPIQLFLQPVEAAEPAVTPMERVPSIPKSGRNGASNPEDATVKSDPASVLSRPDPGIRISADFNPPVPERTLSKPGVPVTLLNAITVQAPKMAGDTVASETENGLRMGGPSVLPAHKPGERFADFFKDDAGSGGKENSRPDSGSLPDWEISLRADSQSDPLSGHLPFHGAGKTTDHGADGAFRATLPQLPVLIFQRLAESAGNPARAESHHQEFVVQVEPEHLGRVQVAVEMHQGRIAARIAVDSDAVRQAMDAQLPALKAALEQQGLRLESIEVSVQDRHASLLNPDGRDAESFFHHRRSQGRGEAGHSEIMTEAEPIPGETGRRFGFNTVEYFA